MTPYERWFNYHLTAPIPVRDIRPPQKPEPMEAKGGRTIEKPVHVAMVPFGC